MAREFFDRASQNAEKFVLAERAKGSSYDEIRARLSQLPDNNLVEQETKKSLLNEVEFQEWQERQLANLEQTPLAESTTVGEPLPTGEIPVVQETTPVLDQSVGQKKKDVLAQVAERKIAELNNSNVSKPQVLEKDSEKKAQVLEGAIPEPELPKERIDLLNALEQDRIGTIDRLRVDPSSSIAELSQDKALTPREWDRVLINSQRDAITKRRAQNILELTATASRGGWGIAQDVILDAGAGLIDSAGGLAVAGTMATQYLNPLVSANSLLEALGVETGEYGKAIREMQNGNIKTAVEFAEFIGQGADYLRDARTDPMKAQAELFEQAISKLGEDASLSEQVKTTFSAAMDNPLMLASLASESLPDLFTGGAIGFLTKRATKTAIKELGEKGATEAMEKLASKKSADVAEGIMIMYNAGVEGGNSAQEAFTKIMGMDHDYLMEVSKDYRELIESNVSEEDAKLQVAANSGLVALVTSGLISGGASKVTGAARVETSLGRAIPDRAKAVVDRTRFGKSLVRAGAVAGGQVIEEGIQEGGAGFGTNLGVRATDETQILTEGVGVQATLGALAGGTVGSGLSVPAVVGGAVEDTTKLIGKTETGKAVKKAVATAKDVEAALSESEGEITEETSGEPKEVNPNSFTEYSNPESPHYNPLRAAAVILSKKYLDKSGLNDDPEKGLEVANKGLEYVADAINQHNALLEKYQSEGNIEGQKQVLNVLNELETQQYQLNNLVEHLNNSESVISKDWAVYKEQVKEAISFLDSDTIDDPNIPEEQKFVSNEMIEDAFKYLGSDPRSLPKRLLEQAASSDNEEIAKRAQVYQRAQANLEALEELKKDVSDVHNDVMDGGFGFLGITKYQNIFEHAIKTGNDKLAAKHLITLGSFTSRHKRKAELARLLSEESRKPADSRIENFDELAKEYRETYSDRDAKGNIKGKGAYINSTTPAYLIETIEAEASALESYFEVAVDQVGVASSVKTTPVAQTQASKEEPTQTDTTEEKDAPEAPTVLSEAQTKTTEEEVSTTPEGENSVSETAPDIKEVEKNDTEQEPTTDNTNTELPASEQENRTEEREVKETTQTTEEVVAEPEKDTQEEAAKLRVDAEKFIYDFVEKLYKGRAEKSKSKRRKETLKNQKNALRAFLQTQVFPSFGDFNGNLTEYKAKLNTSYQAIRDFETSKLDVEKYQKNHNYREVFKKMEESTGNPVKNLFRRLNNRRFFNKAAQKRYSESGGKDDTRAILSRIFNLKEAENPLHTDPNIVEKLTTKVGIEQFIEEQGFDEKNAVYFREVVQPFLADYMNVSKGMFKGASIKLGDGALMEDPLQVFVNADSNKELDEVFLLASGLSSLSWFVNTAQAEVRNDKQSILSTLTTDTFTADISKTFSYAGSHRNRAIAEISMGTMRLLGMTPKNKVPTELDGQFSKNLQAAVGLFGIDVLSTPTMDLLEQRELNGAILDTISKTGRLPSWATVNPETGETDFVVSDKVVAGMDERTKKEYEDSWFLSNWFVRTKLNFTPISKDNPYVDAEVDQRVQRMFDLFNSSEIVSEGEPNFSSVFGRTGNKAMPSFEPVKHTQKKVANSVMNVPKIINDLLTKHQAKPLTLTRAHSLFETLGREFSVMVGGTVKPMEQTTAYEWNKGGDANKKDLERDYEAAFKFIELMRENDKEEFFIEHILWSNFRMGVKGVINPQNSKLMRHIFGYKDYNQVYSADDSVARMSLTLAFAQSMGVDIDTNTLEEIASDFSNLIGVQIVPGDNYIEGNPDYDKRIKIQNAILGIQTLNSNNSLEPEDVETIKEAILAAAAVMGEGYHSFHGLVEMANVMEFTENYNDDGTIEVGFTMKREDFTSDMVTEVDGKTNGAAFLMLQLTNVMDKNDPAYSEAEILNIIEENLKKVGVFMDGTESLNEYKAKYGPLSDVYLTVGTEWAAFKKELEAILERDGVYEHFAYDRENPSHIATKKDMDAVNNILSGLFDKVRNLAKTPVMTTLYSAGPDSTIAEFVEESIVTMYRKIMNGEIDQSDLENFGFKLNGDQINQLKENPREFLLDSKQEKIVRDAITNTYGVALSMAYQNGLLSHYIKQQADLTKMANLSFAVFDKEMGLKKQAHIVQFGVEPDEETTLGWITELAYLAPIYPAYFSDPDDPMTWQNVMKRGSVMTGEGADVVLHYQNNDPKGRQLLNKTFGRESDNSAKRKTAKTVSSKAKAERYVFNAPGVSTGPTTTQMMDAATMLKSFSDSFAELNIHDAKIMAALHAGQSANSINKSFSEVSQEMDIMATVVKHGMEAFKHLIENYPRKEVLKTLKVSSSKFNEFQADINEIYLRSVDNTARREELFKRITTYNQYAYLNGAHKVEESSPEQIVEDFKKELDNNPDTLGSGPESMDNFNHNRTERLTTASFKTMLDEMVKASGSAISDTHTQWLEELTDSLFSFVEEVEIKLQEQAQSTLGRYDTKNNVIEMMVGNPLLTKGKTPAEVFAHEMVHAVLHQAFKLASPARRRFEHAYKVAAKHMPRDWFVTPGMTAQERESALATYDYIFGGTTQRNVEKVDPITGIARTMKESAGLDEFAAYALTNPRMIEFLNRDEIKAEIVKGESKDLPVTKSKSGLARKIDHIYRYLHNAFVSALSLLNNKVFLKFDSSARAQNIMLSLAQQVAHTHQKHLSNLQNKKESLLDKYGNKTIKRIEYSAIKKLAKVTRPNKEKRKTPRSSLGTIMSAGKSTLHSLATSHLLDPETSGERLMEGIGAFRSQLKADVDGFLSTIAREMVGQTSKNRVAYALQRLSKNVVDQNRVNAAGYTGQFLINAFRSDLTKATRSAIGNVVVSTDLASLLYDTTRFNEMTEEEVLAYLNDPSNATNREQNFEMITQMLSDSVARQAEITRLENELRTLMQGHPEHTMHYIKMARSLGVDMVTGVPTQHLQGRNAYEIAHLLGTTLNHTGREAEAEAIIDKLATLIAVDNTNTDERNAVVKLIQDEYTLGATTDNHGIMKTLAIHARIQNDARIANFNGQKIGMIKGYTKQVLDPNKDVVMASEDRHEELIASGYRLVTRSLGKDVTDITSTRLNLYVSDVGKTRTYMKQVFSLNSKKSRGTSLRGMDIAMHGDVTMSNQVLRDEAKKITHEKQKIMRAAARHLDPTVNGPVMRPIFNQETGEIVDYVYAMNERLKHDLLDKQDMFDVILGETDGSIIGKTSSELMNQKAIEYLHEDYMTASVSDKTGFVEISAESTNPEYRQYWFMLPKEARMYAKTVTGKDSLMLRPETVRLFFGYRKENLGSLVDKKLEARINKEKEGFTTAMLEHISTMANSKQFRTFEQFWQEIVVMAKDAIVNKTGAVLVANIMSNNVVLSVEGLSPLKIWSYQREAWTAIEDYQNDRRDLANLKMELESNKALTASQIKKMKAQMSLLEDSISRNPAIDLLNSGVYQTIVEDVDFDNEYFTFKGGLERKLEPVLDKVPNVLKDVGNTFFMTHDTRLYKALANATQKSDFVARYALHKYNMENGMSYGDSINRIMDSFIDYDTPTHPTIQYLNDMGLIMFTKFFFRIQKVLIRQMREKPAQLISFYLLEGILGSDIPDIADVVAYDPDNWWNRMYGIFDIGSALAEGNIANLDVK